MLFGKGSSKKKKKKNLARFSKKIIDIVIYIYIYLFIYLSNINLINIVLFSCHYPRLIYHSMQCLSFLEWYASIYTLLFVFLLFIYPHIQVYDFLPFFNIFFPLTFSFSFLDMCFILHNFLKWLFIF
jgi:hypothetical protein